MKIPLRKFSLGRLAFLLCGVLALALTGCMDSASSDSTTPEPVPFISFYHGSPDAPDFNILLDNVRLNNQAFKYANASNYLAVTAGSRKIQFTPVTASAAVLDTSLSFQQEKAYSLFVVNRLQEIEMLAVEDKIITPATGKAAVRLVHLSPDAPAVDVAVGSAATPVFSALNFKQNTPFVEVAAGTSAFRVRGAGTEADLLPATNFTLDPGANYTLIVRGFQAPPAGNSNVLVLQIVRNF